ncbi:Dps family protein [Caryophanon tenue]|uniref:DNA starvation/stationary phase protection protein n=1 Tax=Caryophanon tenue TaxID=33978 RepID=A0A1C0Y745_9BACL|nr:Dps family protein [Caryophanon tenue]OCS82982.1 DNA starvation/stationary phase protection protein [Caryophanon tenue]
MTIEKQLNELVASWSILYTKLHNYHWYVSGPTFFTLHAKFEELYTEAALHLDELAERILSRGEKPVATLKEQLKVSLVDEAKGTENASQMVQQIVKDFTTVKEASKQVMDAASEEGDDRTEDLLNGIIQSLEKHAWMLNAFLGDNPKE